MSTCLFIGGIADGTRRKVEGDHELVRVPHYPDPEWYPPGHERKLNVSTYKRTLFRDADGRDSAIYILAELGSAAIALLVERYPEAGKLTVDKADIETVLRRHGDESPEGRLAFGLALKRLSRALDEQHFRGCRAST